MAVARNNLPALNTRVPRRLQSRLFFLADQARNMGIHMVSGKGSGKSRMLGRVIAWQDFIRGIPLVIFDPHGPTIDNFLDKLTRLPADAQRRLWPRVLYVDMSGSSGNVIPFPLYYRLGNDNLFTISQRYLNVVRRLDPFLQTASVQGWNPLRVIGTNAGMVLAALGLQITEAEDLVRHPERWKDKLAEAVRRDPDAEPAAAFFTQELATLNTSDKHHRTESFLNKVDLFKLDPTMKAMFGANTPGINWQRVMDVPLAVLFDFRHELDLERMRFKLLWSFRYLMDFVQHRGHGRHKPISLVIDEITYVLSDPTLHGDLLASDMNELINRLARNYMIWLTLCHQEMYQVSESIQKSLLTMGTQIFGSTTDLRSAIEIGRRYFRYNPYLVKKTEAVYGMGTAIDYRTVEFTMDEQAYLHGVRFLDLPRYHFLVSPAFTEGTMPTHLSPVSIENLDPDIYTNEPLVAQARDLLMQRNGLPVSKVLAEIAARTPQAIRTSRLAG
jgi:hypothetical protein